MLGMTNISESERQEIKAKLMGLYEKLGRIRDYFNVKDGKNTIKEKPSARDTTKEDKFSRKSSFLDDLD
jgi:hypothetical protein